jgi:hypothetical protein
MRAVKHRFTLQAPELNGNTEQLNGANNQQYRAGFTYLFDEIRF